MRQTALVDMQISSRLRALVARFGASGIGSRLARWKRAGTRVLHPLRWAVRRLRAPLARRRAARWRGVAYDDGRVRLEHLGSENAALVLRGYYWPTGTRRIPLSRVVDVSDWPVTGVAGYRLHGPGRRRRWYPRDKERPGRAWGLAVRLDDGREVILTPDEPVQVRDLLKP